MCVCVCASDCACVCVCTDQVARAIGRGQVTLDVAVEHLDGRLDEAAARKVLVILDQS